MKTLAYLDCVTGVAGDMCLGALVHAGVPLDYLTAQLGKLGIGDEFSLRAEQVRRNGQAATKVFVDVVAAQLSDRPHEHGDGHRHEGQGRGHHPHEHGGRRLPEIERLLEKAGLPGRSRDWSLAIFRRLARAEAAVHGIPPEQVHFHEVGATDAIVDIVGTCLGLDWLGVDGLVCSALPTGGGTVRCEHGLLPVPAPAVLSLMASAQIPVYGNGIEKELVTPTGCAIVATLARSFGPPPPFVLKKVGLGAGGRDLVLPNILRLWIGTVDELPVAERLDEEGALAGDESVEGADWLGARAIEETEADRTAKNVVMLQTQLDDLSPQVVGYAFDLLFAAGAVDVFAQPVMMKKNRSGLLLSVLCPEAAAGDCERVLFRETTTLGIRRIEQRRSVLQRKMVSVQTGYGPVSVKVGRLGDEVLNVQPEFEDCAGVARSREVPLKRVQQAAMEAAAYLWG